MLKPLTGTLLSLLLFQACAPQPRPTSRQGAALLYNFPPASRGDRFAPKGLSPWVGLVGWSRYGPLIKRVAHEQGIQPYVLGAYVWLESEFDARQDYKHGKLRAIGLGSVQAQDFPHLEVETLFDPYRNLTLTAKEFRTQWKPHDMAGTVMDVWYPAWRRKLAKGESIPVIHSPDVYVQAIANRYFALHALDTAARHRQHMRKIPWTLRPPSLRQRSEPPRVPVDTWVTRTVPARRSSPT